MKPHRRTALKSLAALAAGLFAAPPVVQAKAYKASRPGPWDDGMTPAHARLYEEEYGLVLAAVYEVEYAVAAAAGLHAADCRCELCADVGGIQFHADAYAAMFEGEAPPQCSREAKKIAARRLREGTPDPVWQVEIALDRAIDAVSQVGEHHADRGCEGCTLCDTCRGAEYAFDLFGDMWRCTAHRHLRPESKAEQYRRLISDYEANPAKYHLAD